MQSGEPAWHGYTTSMPPSSHSWGWYDEPLLTTVNPASPHTTLLLHPLGTRWAGTAHHPSLPCVPSFHQVGGVICEAQYFQNVMRVGFQLRQAMVAAVFSKSLRLSHSGRQGFSTGRITNMMTNDAESLQMVCQQLHGLWSAPLRILVCIFLLYQQLGVASLLGLLMLLLMILAQAVIVNRVQKLVKASLQRSDKRVALMSEVLAAMDVVKLYTWEESFQSKVARVRADEMGQISKAQYIMAVSCVRCDEVERWRRKPPPHSSLSAPHQINFLLMSVLPVLVTVVSFGCYSLLGHQLTAAKAFTSISLFAVLHYPLHMFPSLITQEMLLAGETDIDAPAPPIDPTKPAVEVSHASFAWGAANTAAANTAAKEEGEVGGEGKEKDVGGTLTDVTLSVEPGKLVAVVGATGQGKSSLVSALLGEMPMVSGDSPPIIRGRVAYVSQVSWIFNATVRENILFGLPYDKQRYERAVRVSALERDLELLPGGDLTEIGERGVNVSGGQKQRISIARAVYSDADVFFFDDPLSALDAHVAKQVYDTCVRTELAGRTRIMVTNQLHFLPEQGPYVQLKASAPKFQRLLEKAGALEEHGDTEVGGQGGGETIGDAGGGRGEASAEAAAAAAMCGSSTSSGGGGGGSAAAENGGSSSSSSQVGEKSGAGEGEKSGAGKGEKSGAGKGEKSGAGKGEKSGAGEGEKSGAGGTTLVQAEEKAQGVVSAAVVWRYVRAMGGWGVLAVLISLYVLVEAARVLSSVWISIWTGESGGSGGHGSLYFVAGYSLISLGQVLLTFANQYFLVFSSQRAARRLHDAMLAAILRAPMSFFHTNPEYPVSVNVLLHSSSSKIYHPIAASKHTSPSSPPSSAPLLAIFAMPICLPLNPPTSPLSPLQVGRLINRFTKDTADIDKNLAQYTSLCLGGIFQLLSTFALIGVLNTVALWAIVPLLLLFYIVYLYFQSTAREVKRWDSVTRSPVYSQVRLEAAHDIKPNAPSSCKTALPLPPNSFDSYPHFPLQPGRSPLRLALSQFAEALNGLATIRAYRAARRMAAMNGRAVDRNTRFTLVSMSANRWLAFRLEFLGGLMIFATAVFAVMDVQRAGDQAALAPVMGLILVYALQITAMMTMVLRLLSVAGECPFKCFCRVNVWRLKQITAMMTMELRLLSIAGECPFKCFCRVNVWRLKQITAMMTMVLRLLSVAGECPFKCFCRVNVWRLKQITAMMTMVLRATPAPAVQRSSFATMAAPRQEAAHEIHDTVMLDSFDFLGDINHAFLDKQATPTCLNDFKLQAIKDFKKSFLKYRTLQLQYNFMEEQKAAGIIPHSIRIKPFGFVCNSEELCQEADKDLQAACEVYCKQAQGILIAMKKKAVEQARNDTAAVFQKLQDQVDNYINLAKKTDIGTKNSKLTDNLNFFKHRVVSEFKEAMSIFVMEANLSEIHLKEKKREIDEKKAAATEEAENLPVDPTVREIAKQEAEKAVAKLKPKLKSTPNNNRPSVNNGKKKASAGKRKTFPVNNNKKATTIVTKRNKKAQPRQNSNGMKRQNGSGKKEDVGTHHATKTMGRAYTKTAGRSATYPKNRNAAAKNGEGAVRGKTGRQ
ncbi:unnamed protein product [Closterium sp. Yama58-4]|nr:unnamed protein product [Closterium sp. Yama58-4]